MMIRATLAACVSLAFAQPAFAALVISKDPTSNVSCASGVCTATAADAVLNETDLKHLLGAADLTLASGSAAQDIVFDTKLQWATAHGLKFDSFRGIVFDFELTSQGTGGVTLVTNDGGTGGTLVFRQKGKITFWDISSSLVIDGVQYALANDIATLAALVAANPSRHYAWGRGYDASADGTYAAAPIVTAFSGTLTGLGHTISNLKIEHDRPGHGDDGFFGTIAAGGRVSDLGFAAASMISHGRMSFIGIVASHNAGTIENVSADGTISVDGRLTVAGGLVGDNSGTILHSRSSGTITALGPKDAMGAGLVGQNDGSISGSSSSAAASSNYKACGLVVINDGLVTQSFATGATAIAYPQNSDHWAAGLVCTNQGKISQSFAAGPVEASFGHEGEGDAFTAYGGGLVGENAYKAMIMDSYSTAPVDAKGSNSIGGLVGESTGSIFSTYASGAVTNFMKFGGVMGEFLQGNQIDGRTYWDTDSTGVTNLSQAAGNLPNVAGCTGLTTAQLQAGLPAGFDPAIWGQNAAVNGGLPYLLSNPPQ